MLKLTERAMSADIPIYIRADRVIAIQTMPSGVTEVVTVAQRFRVTETSEQIMAMPEMVRAVNPLVSLHAVGDWGNWGSNDPGRSILSTNR